MNTEKVKCDNCDWEGDASDVKEIKDFWERVDAGGVMPSGECPKCGALAYPVTEPRKVTIWTMDCDTDMDGCQVHVFTKKTDLEQWQWNLLKDTAKDDIRLAALIEAGESLEVCWDHFLDNPPNHLDNYNVDEHTIQLDAQDAIC